MTNNMDPAVTEGFGDEWRRFDQRALSPEERNRIFEDYFRIFPFGQLPEAAVGMDVGCGSGRWAQIVAPRVGTLLCVDASPVALAVAKRNCANLPNVEFIEASVGDLPVPDTSQDFAYSLGVLHHVPNTQAAIESIVRKLKPGAPLLLYLYYSFENRPAWYKLLWRISELGRAVISKAPFGLRYVISQTVAFLVYWPGARCAAALEKLGVNAENFPLYYYRDKSLYVLRTDALDRFGTRLEKRFSQDEIRKMLMEAGCEPPSFSADPPHWVALTRRCC